MCLAVPACIKSIDDNRIAQVDLGGMSLEVSLALTPEAKVGDYVIVHTGFAISVMDEADAMETLALFAEMAAADDADLADEEAGA
jgi:hydrogenase expression/formation protein HypC